MIKNTFRTLFKRLVHSTPRDTRHASTTWKRARHQGHHPDEVAPADGAESVATPAAPPSVPARQPAPPPPAREARPSTAKPAAREPKPSEFSKLDIHERILLAVDDLGFSQCTPVQRQSLPPCLNGDDVAGQAQTGTGKTAAFLITILQHYLRRREKPGLASPFALVLAPTRELAVQIGKDAVDLSKYCGMKSLVVYGGMHYKQQREKLSAGVDLVIATPGRLLDYTSSRVVDLSKVEILVIDEADRMLDMGFVPDVRRIVGYLPRADSRQTMLFSATLNEPILRLASRWMRQDPTRVEIEPEHVVPVEVAQLVYAVPERHKLALLLWLLRSEGAERILVFRNRRVGCTELVRQLSRYGVPSELLTGDVEQRHRLRVLEAFRAGEVRVIVATDVAGRGIHVDNISHVVNFDLPYEPEDYVHRVGRTGRAGVKGNAVSFACEGGGFVLPEIETLANVRLESVQPTADMLQLPEPCPLPPPKTPSQGGGRASGGRSRRGSGGRGAPQGRGRSRPRR